MMTGLVGGSSAEAISGGPADALLRLEDLRVMYRTADGDVPAVRGVDLTLPPGGRLGLAGESGCGKSTLAGALLRLLPKSARVSGRVLLGGEDVLGMSWGRLRAVRWAQASIVFQGAMHSLNPVRRVGDQIAEPILVHAADPVPGGGAPSAGPGAGPAGQGSSRVESSRVESSRVAPSRAEVARRVGQLLDQVGLPASRADAYPHELSGGQRQRVMIAMALACSPRLIIADEPTTALDVMIQAQVLRLLGTLVAEHGIGLVMISHDLAVLAEHCDRLAVMYAGRIVEECPADRILADARHPYGRALADAFPRIGDPASRRGPRGLAGDPPDPARLGPGCTFAPRCPIAAGECRIAEPVLVDAGADRRAACVRLDVPDPVEGWR